MRTSLRVGILLAVLLSVSGQSVAPIQSAPPAPSPIILEATNVVHDAGYVATTLLVRLREDGTFEWERNLDARKREKRVAKVSAEVVQSTRRRLNALDQSSFTGIMGPYGIYVDTLVELKIHLANNEYVRDFIMRNPWPGTFDSKPMPAPAKELLCELRRLRAFVSGEQLPADCKDP